MTALSSGFLFGFFGMLFIGAPYLVMGHEL